MSPIYILIGSPLSGKETQGELLEKALHIPRFSMGHLIREARSLDSQFEEAYQEYSMKGKHLPDSIKFPLLEVKMNETIDTGFILDNFPGTAEDIQYLEKYLLGKTLEIKAVICLSISEDEMRKRFETAKEKRGRADDTFEVVHARREIQDHDRIAVLDYFRNLSLLHEIDGEQEVEKIHHDIMAMV